MRSLASAALLCSALGPVASPGTAAQDRAVRIEAVVRGAVASDSFSGAVVVAAGGDVIYAEAVGLANREWRVPNDLETRFLIGSATKQFTAVLVLALVEDGLLTLSGTITDYLPEYRSDTGSRVTIAHLLSHSSGIPDYGGPQFFQNDVSRELDRAEFLELLSGDLEFAPGTASAYSNSGYRLLGMIVERVTQQPFAHVLRQKVLEPAGLPGTGVRGTAVVPRLASGYVRAGGAYRHPRYEHPSNAFALGDMYATPLDLVRFNTALHGGELVSRESLEQMLTRGGATQWRPDLHFGFGGMVGGRRIGGQVLRVHEYGGNAMGFTCAMVYLLDHDIFVAVLKNVGPEWFDESIHRLAGAVLEAAL